MSEKTVIGVCAATEHTLARPGAMVARCIPSWRITPWVCAWPTAVESAASSSSRCQGWCRRRCARGVPLGQGRGRRAVASADGARLGGGRASQARPAASGLCGRLLRP